MMHTYFHCREWTPKLQNVARELITTIYDIAPELEVLFMGAGALQLPGKNDIDLDILCAGHDLQRYIHLLMPALGAPQKLDDTMAIWEYEYKGFEVDAILSDPSAPNSHIPKQQKVFQTLQANPALLAQYKALKEACDGLPYNEYERRKQAFFEHSVLAN